MLEALQVVQTDERMTAVIHLTVARAEIAKVMGPAMAEVAAVLAAQGIAPAGPCFSYHLTWPAETFDFEVGFPVAVPVAAAGRVKPGRLPAAQVARSVYRGGYEGLGEAWGEFCARASAAGLKGAGRLWESYAAGPETGAAPAHWRTELNLPLAP